MAFKYLKKKTLRRKRRFLKRKGAKTYRRSPTKRRSMRGGVVENWNVKVKYVEYNRDQTFQDADEDLDKFGTTKEGVGSFKLFYQFDNAFFGVLSLFKVGNSNEMAWYPKAENPTEFIPDPDDVACVIPYEYRKLFRYIKQGDKRVVSFEKNEQSPQQTIGTPRFPQQPLQQSPLSADGRRLSNLSLY